MPKVSYTISVRKQLEWLVILLFIVCLAGWALYPVNTPIKAAAFIAFIVSFGAVVIFKMKKLATAAACPNCGADLYEVIQAARLKKVLFRHCPACGEGVEV